MTRIAELLAAGPTYSFEFGPPRTPEQEERLAKTLLELEPLGPSFVSVTYGAGGSTRDTISAVSDQRLQLHQKWACPFQTAHHD